MFQISRRSASAVNDSLTQLRTNTIASVWLTQLNVAEVVRAASSAIDVPPKLDGRAANCCADCRL